MIGKIADVGLFAERTEITITHKTTEDLENELMGVLKDYIDVEAKEVEEEVDEMRALIEGRSEEVEDVGEVKDVEEVQEQEETPNLQ
jgi:hypothetical protein